MKESRRKERREGGREGGKKEGRKALLFKFNFTTISA